MSLAGVRPHAGMRRIAAVLAAAVTLGLALLAGGVSEAVAHATLLRSEPADDAMLAAAPERFRLIFNEPASPLALKLVGPDGAVRTLDRVEAKGAELAIEAPPDMAAGSHALSWRVVSEDGHPVGGTLVFSIGARSDGGAAGAPAPDRTLQAAIWTARLALYLGLFVGVGGAFALAWLGGGLRARLVAAATMAAGLAAAALSVGLQGADTLEASLAALLQPILWSAGFATSFGRSATIAAAALALGLISLRLSGASAKAASALALAGVGLALAASGHASAAEPQWLTRPAVFLHAIGVAFWLGALPPLGFALAGRRQDAAALRRFSNAAPVAVGAIVVAGAALAVVQLGSVAALWTTVYGAVLMTKLALLAPLFGLAALNRWRLTAPASAGQPVAERRLRRSIVAELVLAALIFGVVAGWRFTPPPRSLAAAAAEPVSIHIHTAKAMADLTLTPGRIGRTSASIVIMTGDFGPLDAKEVTLVVSNDAAGLEPIRRSAQKPGDGMWRVDDLILPVAGRWTVRLDVLVSDFELVKLDGAIDVRR